MRLPIPSYRAISVHSLTPDFLRGAGIRLLLLDLDNTLIAYGGGSPDAGLAEWARTLASSGIELYILSNNRRGHARSFSRKLGVDCIDRAGKPSPKAVLRVLREKNMDASMCALAGDQIFTDILCAVRAGVTAILVSPVDISNVFRRIRYALEYPFRSRCDKFAEDCLFDKS